jgi:hypothetical protein
MSYTHRGPSSKIRGIARTLGVTPDVAEKYEQTREQVRERYRTEYFPGQREAAKEDVKSRKVVKKAKK